MEGLILKNQNGYFSIYSRDEALYLCRSRGRLKRQTEILVGDRVDYEVPRGSEAAIVAVHPRKNRLYRPPVANVDRLILTIAAKEPAVSLYTLDKMILLAENAEMDPVICINKADLDPPQAAWIQSIYEKAGYSCFIVSARTGEGLAALQSCLTQKIIAFSGPSGVGKSSLLNLFLKDSPFLSGDISKKTGRGKNTTRHAELAFFAGQTFLMDTPGYTSLSVEDVAWEDLGYLFKDFRPYLGSCRFRNCAHQQEPDCAVRDAVHTGAISHSRYQSYLQILQEIKKGTRK